MIFDCYIRCYGELSNLQDIQVVIGYLKLPCPNLIDAIDLLFKVVKDLQKKFPACAKPIWQFIEKTCFTLPVPRLLESVTNLSQLVGGAVTNVDQNSSRKRKTASSTNKRVQQAASDKKRNSVP